MEPEYPTTKDQTPKVKTSEDALKHIKALIAENLLSQDQVDQLIANPFLFLLDLLSFADNRKALAEEVVKAITVGYFQSLILKTQEGEVFHAERLQKALMRAQTIAVESLAEALQNGAVDTNQKIRITELLKDA